MKSYLETNDYSDCCGCGACVQVCPQNCMHMEENEETFFYPVIDKEKCINCGLCIKVCPFSTRVENPNGDPVAYYGGYSLDEEILKASSSGGIFSVLANKILDQGGKVYGAYFDRSDGLFHIGIDTTEDLYKLQCSKYIQSDTKNTFREVKEELLQGKKVLYAGTPCQIAGLKLFLNKSFENLITVDFICHGVPSLEMFWQYVKYLENKHKGDLKEVCFREKLKYGWSITISYTIDTLKRKLPFVSPKLKYYKDWPSFYIRQNKVNRFIVHRVFSAYFSSFLGGYTQRESCYKCYYASLNRASDITLADFWGYQKNVPELKNDKGLSLVIAHNTKAVELINILEDVYLKQLTKEQAITDENYNLDTPTRRPVGRENVYKDLKEKGYAYIAEKYGRPANYKREYLKWLIPKPIRDYIIELKNRI